MSSSSSSASAAAAAADALRRSELNYLASPTPSWLPRSALQWLRFATCALTLLPLRVAGILLVALVAALAAALGTLGARRGARARSWWRAPFLFVARQCPRALLLLLGFWYVEETGFERRPAVGDKARAAVVVSNHLGPFEAIYLKWRLGDCIMLAAQDSFANPVLRTIAEAIGIVLFDRSAPVGIKDLIVKAARDPLQPQLLIFPEACCSNGS